MVDSTKKSVSTKVISTTMSKSIVQKSKYIFDNNLPYWIIYRDDFFDKVFGKMKFGIFDVFRDRQITNQNTSQSKSDKYAIRVLKSRNILDTGELVDIDGYDAFIDLDTLSKFTVFKFINNTEVYLTPNMTYKPRMIKKDAGYVVNGSVAILIPKDENLYLTDKQLKYISSGEFRAFYRIARNYQTRSLNIDKASCYWFGINQSI